MNSVVFLGTISATPTKHCNVSGIAIKHLSGRIWLVDCGEGTQHQILRTDLVKASRLECIFITHLHGDHCFGLPGLLASISLTGQVSNLKLYGPAGIKELIETNIRLSATYLTYKLEITELQPEITHNLGKISDITVSAHPLKHKDVPCFAFLFEEDKKPDVLNGQKAAKLGAKGKQLGELKIGKDVTLPNGTIIKASDVLEPGKPGKKVFVLGDTSDSMALVPVGMGSDVLIHETTYDCDMEEKAIEGGHSTSTMAGKFAHALKAKKLIITHFSKRYVEGLESKGEAGKGIEDLRKETQKECPQTVVEAAKDLCAFDI